MDGYTSYFYRWPRVILGAPQTILERTIGIRLLLARYGEVTPTLRQTNAFITASPYPADELYERLASHDITPELLAMLNEHQERWVVCGTIVETLALPAPKEN